MKARVKWIEGLRFLGGTPGGHGVVMDASQPTAGNAADTADGGGSCIAARRLGPSPMEMLLLGAGGCAAIDVVHILKKMRQDATDCAVTVEGTRAEEHPQVFTRIHMTWTVTGHGLSREQVERAVELSAERYCSASVMLGKTARMTRDVHVVEA